MDYNNTQKELKNNKKTKEDEIDNKNIKHIEYYEESKKLADYIKNYCQTGSKIFILEKKQKNL